jgi:uncharacterized protein (DUF4415 family)
MSGKHIVRRSAKDRRRGETDWARVDALSEEELMAAARSDPDAQPTDAEFWKAAKLVLPERKVQVALRVDPDVLRWFKAQGRGYQTRMNAVLRAYMEAHRKAG